MRSAMYRPMKGIAFSFAVVAALTWGSASAVAGPKKAVNAKLRAKAEKSVERGLEFLRGKQMPSGSYGDHVGVTATALRAFATSHKQHKYDAGPFVARAADWLAAQVRTDGAISGEATPTYNTALSIMALQAVDPVRFKSQIEGGQKFLSRFQADEDHKYKPSDKFYGGIGYGGDERPDLSNLQYALEALKETGFEDKDDVWAKAQVFVTRCQNRSESNDQDWAGNDGGFVYAPGQSPAGGTRSYGAMTFAGLKSLIFTKADKDDPRVKSTLDWIGKNYDFNQHPGMGTTSFYYYLQTAAGALAALNEPYLMDDKGRKRNWAADMLSRMIDMQRENGSWINENPKYWEGNDVFTTARALVTMNYALR